MKYRLMNFSQITEKKDQKIGKMLTKDPDLLQCNFTVNNHLAILLN